MLENKIHTFESPDKTAEAVAQVISDKINAKNDFFYLAVSGGNTPKILFEILAEKYLKKGSEIALEGKLTNRTYEDKNKETHYITEIVVNSMLMLDKKEA